MTHDEIEAVATNAARKALAGFFVEIGLDTSDPFALQKDFLHLRSWRQAVEDAKRRGLLAAVTVLVTGFLGLLYALITHKI